MNRTLLLRLVATLAAAGSASAQPVLFNTGPGATGHYYQRMDTAGHLTYQQALGMAAETTYSGVAGHLATFDGSDPVAEQSWVLTNVVRTPGLPNPTLPSLYWFGASRPDTSSAWTWLDGSAVPPSILGTWQVDNFEGAGAYAAVMANNYSADEGDYRQDDPANRMGGFVVEYDTHLVCGWADVGIAGGQSGHDGLLDNNDFIAFITLFFAGC